MKIAQLIQAAAVTALFASSAASAAGNGNLISNGDFEAYTVGVASGGYTKVDAGSSAITGWTIGGVSVDLIKNSYGSVSGTSVDMLGTPGPGSLSQLFSYNANTTYTLSFDVSRNPNGSYTALSVDVNGIHHEYVGTSLATTQSFSFTTGNSAGSQLLQFSSVNGDGYSGAVLDNVTLTAAVPEPETYAMLLGGLGLMGFMARRRSGKKAAK
jgi:choice-of-anchor C domain-containing protein